MIVHNQLSDFRQLAAYLKRLDGALEIALEPTADYHRNLAYFLKTQGFEVKLIPQSLLPERVRRRNNSWDKNDPKDEAFKSELKDLGRPPTDDDVIAIRDRLAKQFGIDGYRP